MNVKREIWFKPYRKIIGGFSDKIRVHVYNNVEHSRVVTRVIKDHVSIKIHLSSEN